MQDQTQEAKQTRVLPSLRRYICCTYGKQRHNGPDCPTKNKSTKSSLLLVNASSVSSAINMQGTMQGTT